jgi:hypothetical protein
VVLVRQLYGNTRLSGSAEIPRNLFLGHALQFFDGGPGTGISSGGLAGASSTGTAIASDNLPEPEKGGRGGSKPPVSATDNRCHIRPAESGKADDVSLRPPPQAHARATRAHVEKQDAGHHAGHFGASLKCPGRMAEIRQKSEPGQRDMSRDIFLRDRDTGFCAHG